MSQAASGRCCPSSNRLTGAASSSSSSSCLESGPLWGWNWDQYALSWDSGESGRSSLPALAGASSGWRCAGCLVEGTFEGQSKSLKP